jgi:hypothetical protein
MRSLEACHVRETLKPNRTTSPRLLRLFFCWVLLGVFSSGCYGACFESRTSSLLNVIRMALGTNHCRGRLAQAVGVAVTPPMKAQSMGAAVPGRASHVCSADRAAIVADR